MQTQINWHSVRTWIILGCIALIAVLGAVGDMAPSLAGSLSAIASVLGIIEHEAAGNSYPVLPTI